MKKKFRSHYTNTEGYNKAWNSEKKNISTLLKYWRFSSLFLFFSFQRTITNPRFYSIPYKFRSNILFFCVTTMSDLQFESFYLTSMSNSSREPSEVTSFVGLLLSPFDEIISHCNPCELLSQFDSDFDLSNELWGMPMEEVEKLYWEHLDSCDEEESWNQLVDNSGALAL